MRLRGIPRALGYLGSKNGLRSHGTGPEDSSEIRRGCASARPIYAEAVSGNWYSSIQERFALAGWLFFTGCCSRELERSGGSSEILRSGTDEQSSAHRPFYEK